MSEETEAPKFQPERVMGAPCADCPEATGPGAVFQGERYCKACLLARVNAHRQRCLRARQP